MKIIVLSVPLVHHVGVELSGRYPPFAVSVSSCRVPAVGAMGEQQGEVERLSLGVKVGNFLQSSAPALKHQIMRLAVGEDADLLQVHLIVHGY